MVCAATGVSGGCPLVKYPITTAPYPPQIAVTNADLDSENRHDTPRGRLADGPLAFTSVVMYSSNGHCGTIRE